MSKRPYTGVVRAALYARLSLTRDLLHQAMKEDWLSVLEICLLPGDAFKHTASVPGANYAEHETLTYMPATQLANMLRAGVLAVCFDHAKRKLVYFATRLGCDLVGLTRDETEAALKTARDHLKEYEKAARRKGSTK